MKQLRVLTGRHAGAQLLLTASAYRIGADEEADIQIVDWSCEPLVLQLTENGHVLAPALDAPDTAGRVFEDFVPRRFADVVLCVGPHDARWPADLQLLERLLQPAAGVRPRASRLPARLIGLGLAGAVLVAGYAAVVSRNNAAAQARTPPEPLLAQVFRAVSGVAPPDLRVAALGDRVVVEGLLAGSAEVGALRELLARFPADRIEHRYAAVSEVAQGISDALSSKELAVAYRGRGVFAITGRTLDAERLRQAAARIAADLAPLVSRIDVAAAQAPAPDRVPVEAMLSSEGLQYVQTRDGAKHLSLLPGPIVELIDPPSRLSP